MAIIKIKRRYYIKTQIEMEERILRVLEGLGEVRKKYLIKVKLKNLVMLLENQDWKVDNS